jgi:hypothetical protein
VAKSSIPSRSARSFGAIPASLKASPQISGTRRDDPSIDDPDGDPPDGDPPFGDPPFGALPFGALPSGFPPARPVPVTEAAKLSRLFLTVFRREAKRQRRRGLK